MGLMDLFVMALIFFFGSFVGLVAGAIMAAGRAADDFAERLEHEVPPVRTTIYSDHVTTRSDQ